ncbi:EAL domain-containing protein [Pseudoalteromonas sp. MMG010]|uniref:EAL domain-containing protein n=1 Tax=Pseudoalteromonas sp. MMG010 TaxID=2822685 RepID=UPI001B39D19D|nr:EAL domain-containing protein [Pseudoalteromonas sp. MMG010]MBQ4832964.1 EAL domain-containing protein [Pseudoalteromonas sp. MMG010]
MDIKTLKFHTLAVVILLFILFIIGTIIPYLVMPTKYTLDKTTPINIIPSYFIDPSKELSVKHVISQFDQFTQKPLTTIPWGFERQNYWLKLNLKNRGANTQNIVSHFDNPMVDHLTVYELNTDNEIIKTHHLGDKEPKLTLFQYSVPHIELALKAKAQRSLLIKVDTIGISKTPVILYRDKEFLDLLRSQSGIWGVFVGVLLMAALYNLVLYFGIKDRVYLVYIGYILSAITLLGAVLGYGFYLWPLEWQLFIHHQIIFFNYTIAFFTLAFCTMFLRYHKDKCWRYKLSLALLGLMVILAISSLFIVEYIAAPIFFVIMVLLYIVCIILIYHKLRSGFRWAKFYVISWVPLILGAAIQPIELTGAIPYSFTTRHAFLMAILCEVVLMAMALADRVRYQRERALYHATHTQQTKLLNSAKLKHAFMNLQAQNRATTLCLIKISHFNSLNTIITSTQGCNLIRYIAEHLEQLLSHEREFTNLDIDFEKSPRVADLGSGVFACISTKTQSLKGLEVQLKKILKHLPKRYEIEGLDLQLSYQAGVCHSPAFNHFEMWLKQGYSALKNAKLNMSKIAMSSHNANLDMDITLAARLQQAIKHDELALYYQPQINISDNQVMGAEALLRWPSDEFSSLSIEELILLAEHTGVINELSLWVIERACKDIHYFSQANLLDHSISVNLSARNLSINNLAEKVENLLLKYQIPANLLKFELTESVLVESQDALIALVKDLAELGVKVVLDDFGTGYASLSYLINYHFSELKIDKSFVMDLPNNPNHQVIVKTAIDLAHNLNLSITVEGVETEEIHNLLTEMGADKGQGYLYSKAISREQYLQWVNRY